MRGGGRDEGSTWMDRRRGVEFVTQGHAAT